nr:class I SAM-dependent methyltransferase [Wenzhouxiangella sp. XN79A]
MFSEPQFTEAAEQVSRILERLGLDDGTVLDLGCGPGRHALPLARAGLAVTAVDTSAYLLGGLETRAGIEGVAVETVQADMRSFERPGAFDAVLVMWTSFGYFEAEDDHGRVLDRILASLKPGGRLLLDVVGLETLIRDLQPVHCTENDDGTLLIERPVLTEHATRLDNEWLLIDGDRVHRRAWSHRVWSAGELSRLLEAHGFAVEAVDGDFDGTPYGLDSDRLIVIARRPPAAGE